MKSKAEHFSQRKCYVKIKKGNSPSTKTHFCVLKRNNFWFAWNWHRPKVARTFFIVFPSTHLLHQREMIIIRSVTAFSGCQAIIFFFFVRLFSMFSKSTIKWELQIEAIFDNNTVIQLCVAGFDAWASSNRPNFVKFHFYRDIAIAHFHRKGLRVSTFFSQNLMAWLDCLTEPQFLAAKLGNR